TYNVWPPLWECQAVRAPGAKCTAPMLSGESLCGWTIGSIHTSPVNQSTGPLMVGGFGSTPIAPPQFGGIELSPRFTDPTSDRTRPDESSEGHDGTPYAVASGWRNLRG